MTSCDVLIVGGGISGAFAAKMLADASFDCIVIDRHAIGEGSTSISTSLIQYELDIPLHLLARNLGFKKAEKIYRFCEEEVGHLAHLVAPFAAQSDFYRCDSLYFATGESSHVALRREYELRKIAGLDIEFIDGSELATRYGINATGALRTPTAAQLNAFALTKLLLQDGVRRGTRVHPFSILTNYTEYSDRVVVHTSAGQIKARFLIFATGYGSGRYLPKQIARLKHTYVVATKPCEGLPPSLLPIVAWEYASPYAYFRSMPDGSLIIGGEDTPYTGKIRPDQLLATKTEILQRKLKQVLPEIRCETDRAWDGIFAETEDGLPYFGSLPNSNRILFLLGYGGNGILFSAIGASILRDQILQRKNRYTNFFAFDRP